MPKTTKRSDNTQEDIPANARSIVGNIKSTISIITNAVARLKENPDAFNEAVQKAQAAIGIITDGAAVVSKGAEELMLTSYLIVDLVKSLSKGSRNIQGPPVAENNICDLDSAMRYVKQTVQTTE